MLLRTEGIVLRTAEYGEADLIVTHLTPAYGILKTFAKSPRKTKSRFGSSLEPLTHAVISFWGKEESSLPRLTQSDIIHPFSGLRASFRCFLKLSELLEMTLSVLPEREPSRTVFRLLLGTMRTMEQDCDGAMAMLCYKVKLLDAAGFLPGMKKCGRCGSSGTEFHFGHGTVLCTACSEGRGHSTTISPGSVNLFRNLVEWDLEKLGRIRPSEGQIEELTAMLAEHLRYVTDRSLQATGWSGAS